ncbi:MAG: carbohydrate kinase [Rhodobacter sp.]|nr:carbohydrate kinase [Rhodobacter sp.]
MADRLIGIDSGGTVTKVGLFDLVGNELGAEGRAVPMSIPAPGFTERDPLAMWAVTSEAIRALLERTGTRPDQVAAVSPSGFGAGAFFLDAAGNPSRYGIVSTDSRSTDLVARWYAEGRAQVAEKAVFTRIFPGHTTALLGWLQENEPETLQNTAHVLWCKDFLRFRLTGKLSTDITDATCPGMWDYDAHHWAHDALEVLGIGEWTKKLPEVGVATELAGTVSAEAAAQTGLLQGTPVARGAYDIITCSLASGITKPDQIGIIGGTFSIASTLHASPLADPVPNHQSLYPVGDFFLASTASATSGSNLEWILKTFLSAEQAQLEADGQSIYDHVNAMVEEARQRPTTMTFLPYLFTGQPAGLVGVKAADALGDVLRAVFEGVTCAHLNDYARLVGDAGSVDPTLIRLAGGVSKSDVWAQMFADAFDLPVEITNGTEFGAKGAAMCGAIGVGAVSGMEEAIAAMVRVERRFEPRPERTEEFKETYKRFRRHSDALEAAAR